MARALALRNKTELVLDTKNGFIRDFTFKRQYALNVFNVKYSTNKLLSFDFPGGYFAKKLSNKIGYHVLIPNYKIVNEFSNFKFEEKWLTQSFDNVIINGYWANERYFSDFEDEIRNDFSFDHIVFSDEIKRLKNKIENCKGTPIAVGVRTYNEINDNSVRSNGFFYTKDEFYKKAMLYIRERVPDAYFYVFTQDSEWVNENLDFEMFNIELIQPGLCDDKDIGEMFLMSICKHYILSNSTFYWWGSWLSPDKKKIVIAPAQWVNSAMDSWVKI